jgi:hypothetical protein
MKQDQDQKTSFVRIVGPAPPLLSSEAPLRQHRHDNASKGFFSCVERYFQAIYSLQDYTDASSKDTTLHFVPLLSL